MSDDSGIWSNMDISYKASKYVNNFLKCTHTQILLSESTVHCEVHPHSTMNKLNNQTLAPQENISPIKAIAETYAIQSLYRISQLSRLLYFQIQSTFVNCSSSSCQHKSRDLEEDMCKPKPKPLHPGVNNSLEWLGEKKMVERKQGWLLVADSWRVWGRRCGHWNGI